MVNEPKVMIETEDNGERMFMIARLEDETIDRIAQRVIELLDQRDLDLC